ncbi:MAG: hypothetical protein ACRC2T_17085 [Thermoguttaceae bacterium]
MSGKFLLAFVCVCIALHTFTAIAAEKSEYIFVPEITDSFKAGMDMCREREIPVIDYHIHLRGGMTAEKAAIRQEKCGVISGVLENVGRDWPLSDNEKLEKFITEAEKARANGKPLLIGIQVNDRDWFKECDPKLIKRLDFVLADTMIMGTNAEGKPQKMWLDDYRIDDPEAWMQRYMEHNMQVLSEPITILANPTYLPKSVEHLYDKLWTEERMKAVIQKSIENDIALEIQATSEFPKSKFFKLAKEMGAKFSFGTNNFDEKPIPVDRWFKTVKELDLAGPNVLEVKHRNGTDTLKNQ